MERDRAAERIRPEDAHLGELVGDHHGGIAEAEGHLHQPAAGDGNPPFLDGAERVDIPFRGRGGAGHDQMRRQRTHGVPPSDSRVRRWRRRADRVLYVLAGGQPLMTARYAAGVMPVAR